MGYMTYYDLTVAAGEDVTKTEEFLEAFEEVTGGYEYSDLEEDVKWYDSDKDMVTLSLMFKDTVFRLYFDGEDSDDEGITYYWNGKQVTQRRAEIPEPDMRLLEGITDEHPEWMV